MFYFGGLALFTVILRIGRARCLMSLLDIFNEDAEKLELTLLKLVIFLVIISFPQIASHFGL